MQLAPRAVMLIAVALAAMFGLAGCGQDPPVKEQTARRLHTMERCLGAVVFPQGDKSSKIWVFKVIGPEHTVDQFKPAFDDYILRKFPMNEKPDEAFKQLPDGWTASKEDKKGAKLLVKTRDAKPLEISVHQRTMRRPVAEKQQDPHGKMGGKKGPMVSTPAQDIALFGYMRYDVDRRVNNWRRELGLISLGSDASYFYERYSVGDKAEAFLVNMTGPGHVEQTADELQFDLPDGNPPWTAGTARWEEVLPKAAAAGFQSKLTIRVQEGEQKAYFTLTTGIGGSIADNVIRWHRQVYGADMAKYKELDEKGVESLLKDIDVAGMKGKFIDVQGPRAEQVAGKPKSDFKDNRTLGVILVNPQTQEKWFFKLTGPDDLIERHVDNFKRFVRNFAFEE